MPPTDVYVWGAPCQPFSSGGRGQGERDRRGRGVLAKESLRYIKAFRPRLTIMENGPIKYLTHTLSDLKWPSPETCTSCRCRNWQRPRRCPHHLVHTHPWLHRRFSVALLLQHPSGFTGVARPSLLSAANAMSPKKKAAGKAIAAQAKSATGPAGGCPEPAPLPASVSGANTDYLAKVQGWIHTILANEIVAGCEGAQPLTISDGGHLQPFDESSFTTAMSMASTDQGSLPQTYKCGGIFFWVNHLWNPVPGVSISERSVNSIIGRHVQEGPPAKLPHAVHVAVTDGNCNIMTFKGHMRAVSPCEFAHAALKACHRDIVNGKGDQVMRQWRAAFLSTEFVFVRLEENQLSMHAFQLREDRLAEGMQVGWTAMQRVQMVIREKHATEASAGKVSSARLATIFTTSVPPSRCLMERHILCTGLFGALCSNVNFAHALHTCAPW